MDAKAIMNVLLGLVFVVFLIVIFKLGADQAQHMTDCMFTPNIPTCPKK